MHRLLVVLALAGAGAATLTCETASAGQTEAHDSAINVHSDAGVRIKAGGKKGSDLVPFSKIRDGDVLELKATHKVSLLFYDSGRIEHWTGPGKITISASKGASDDAKVVVMDTDEDMGEAVVNLPVILNRARLGRGGQTMVRGKDAKLADINEDEAERLEAGRVHYARIRGLTPSENIVPELCLISVLLGLNLYDESEGVLAEAIERCPECEAPKLILEWVENSVEAEEAAEKEAAGEPG